LFRYYQIWIELTRRINMKEKPRSLQEGEDDDDDGRYEEDEG
jgi:hypothetical protein